MVSSIAYGLPPNSTYFIVKNINKERKIIRIFDYPILYQKERDILSIAGIGEGDIRDSLLKGQLRHKLLAQDIIITSSNIDLIQFDKKNKEFLSRYGINQGIEVSSNDISDFDNAVVTIIDGYSNGNYYLIQENIQLIGLKNNINKTFYTPNKFLNGKLPSGDEVHIEIKHNGKTLFEGIDYTIGESEGPGTGYDYIYLTSFTPNTHSILYANYATKK